MKPLTIFSWGYRGWGNSNKQFVQAVDAIERSRGFRLPIFVDVRIRRSVRAKGFNGSAFEKLLGRSRHRWMRSLGNRYIITRSGPPIQIAEPSAAKELLGLALEAASDRRRLLFFCSCGYPKDGRRIACHRHVVGTLLLKRAQQSGVQTEVVEWPGGDPKRVNLDVSDEVFKAVEAGRVTIPLGNRPDLAEFAALPYGSVVKINSNGKSMRVISGPACFQAGEWVLPILYDPAMPLSNLDEQAVKVRRSWRLEPRSV